MAAAVCGFVEDVDAKWSVSDGHSTRLCASVFFCFFCKTQH